MMIFFLQFILTISQGRHQGDGSVPVERCQLVLANAPVDVPDRRPIRGGEPTVDAAHVLIHFFFQVLIFFDIRATRDGDL